MSKLVIFRGDDVETEIHLGSRPVRIGRDSRNDIVLDDKSVTRFHAEVRPETGSFVIVDMKSRTGGWMNGRQIKGKAPLMLGTAVTLGAYELALEDDVATDLDHDSAVQRSAVGSTVAAKQHRPSSQSATQRWSTGSPASDAKRSTMFDQASRVAALSLRSWTRRLREARATAFFPTTCMASGLECFRPIADAALPRRLQKRSRREQAHTAFRKSR